MKTNLRIFALTTALLFLAQVISVGYLCAQSRINSTIKKESGNQTSGYGRDVWFAIPQNYTMGAQKYFTVYVNSLRSTTVNFQVGNGPIIKKPVTIGKATIFSSPTPTKPSQDISISTELSTSGVIETKAIHVWSNDADIAVYLLSRVAYSSGGMYVLPTIGWGKEYIVGAYESIFDPTGQADWPSEFTIVANMDNTIVQITPNWDIRKDQFPSVIEHSKGQVFSVNLNKGECVQYQTVLPINDGECDLTGTIISSNNPVGVMSGSVDPYVPFPYGYGDQCLSMLQPVRSWSDKYFTAPFAGRKYGGDVYCVIGTKSQFIYRNGTEVTKLRNYGDHFFINDAAAASPTALWTSDAPFELMQYIPSATFGTGDPLSGNRNQGDADMCAMNPADQFLKTVYFQTPTVDLASGQTEFTNYVNILLPASHESKTFYDSTLLSSSSLPPNILNIEHLPIANTLWEAIRLTYKPNSGEGPHIVTSDTGIGVYCYGYGTDDSYSWEGNLGVVTVNSPDTIAPNVQITGDCFSLHVLVSDLRSGDSKLNSIVSDSLNNILFTPDPGFISGNGIDSSFYDLRIEDSTKQAFAKIFVYDVAGNRATITSTYQPRLAVINPQIGDYGMSKIGMVLCKNFSIVNTGEIAYSYKSLHLLSGSNGFAINSLLTDSLLDVGDSLVIKICFTAESANSASDTLEFSDGCTILRAFLFANGGTPDFILSDNDFQCVNIGTTKSDTLTVASNQSPVSVTIDTIWVDDPLHFVFNGIPSLPAKINAGTKLGFVFSFKPDKTGNFETAAHLHSIEAGVRTSVLTGCGQIPVFVTPDGYPSSLSKESTEYSLLSSLLDRGETIAMMPPVPNPLTAGTESIRFIYGLKSDSPLDLSIYDILGNPVASVIHDENQRSGIYETDFRLSSELSSGSYIYRLSGAGKVISGKLVIIR